MTPEISLIIPLLNEEDNLRLLHQKLSDVLAQVGRNYELVFIDDGSTDGSAAILQSLHAEDPAHVQVIQFRRNFGKTAALNAGFSHAQGQIVITMDADLQDDPAEIPAMLAKLNEGYDLVAAWRVNRQDSWDKTLPSRFFNFVVANMTEVSLHDFNCGFKVYRRSVTDSIKLYGELHRFIPVLAAQKGFKITEQPVQHHPRHAGVSKYGAGRLLKGFLDFGTVLFLTNYMRRPLHLFGTTGLLVFGGGGVVNFYLAVLWLMREVGQVSSIGPIGTRPLLIVGVLAMILGVQLISIGLLGEMLRSVSFNREEEYNIQQHLLSEPQQTAQTDELRTTQ
jgi:glycosyltransferase involved in cell wall biosynthesis